MSNPSVPNICRQSIPTATLGEPLPLVSLTELGHPFPVVGQTVVVEHEAGEVVLVLQEFQFFDDAGHAPLAEPAEDDALGWLAEITVVNAAAAGDDGQKGRG